MEPQRSVPSIAWVLNLDADLELAALARGRRYMPSHAVLEAMEPHVLCLTATLVEPGDVVVDPRASRDSARGRTGRAFCPTPSAIAILERAGAEIEDHPTAAILREVNSRAFSAALGQTLAGASFVRALDEAREVLAHTPPVGTGHWRLKRAHGMAGRGQRVVTPVRSSTGFPASTGFPGSTSVHDADLAFARSALEEGGLQIEPNVDIVTELGRHAILTREGTLSLGRLVRQECDTRGQWQRTVPVTTGELEGLAAIDQAIEAAMRDTATGLHRAGYFGPFGVDAYTWRQADGAVAIQPRSEINARYTMGFAVGFGKADVVERC
jgi:hypothetical protein